ncbi:Guanine nucleotide exchange factor vav2 [Homalodisca vitripennis]|nr:Guanine nucleotide exchange factor vav2 [Homalodisca vitripennis]
MCVFSEDAPPRTPLGDQVEYAHYDTHVHNEEIYQDLCSIDKKSTLPSQLPTASHSLEKRDYVINELVETEKNYVDVLATLQRCFMRPLGSILKDEDNRIIFMGIKELCEIHAGFHSQLRKVVAPGSSARLSEVFLNWREKFLIYGDYCANLTNAQTRIQDICTHNDSINQEVIPTAGCLETLRNELRHSADCDRPGPAQPGSVAVGGCPFDCVYFNFTKRPGRSQSAPCFIPGGTICDRCQQEANNGKFKLRDILSVPMQRILKYHLLLEKLIQETQPNHEDYRGLERAKEAMVDVAQYINEVKRDSDTLQIMKDIQVSL